MYVSIRRAAVVLGVWTSIQVGFVWGQAVPRGAGPARRPAEVDGPVAPPEYREVDPDIDPRREARERAPGIEPGLRGAVPRQALPQRPQQPPWYPQPQEHQAYVDDVLKYWEQSSAEIERYRCQFRRWEFDPAWTPKDPKTGKRPAIRESEGIIKYARPDKGTFQVTKLLHYTAPTKAGEKAQYLEQKGDVLEHWVCDGKSIFEFDSKAKKLIQHELPPEMHGKAIVDGPLPFLFGANKKQILERYWVGIFTPPNAKGEYWLEAWPKRREEAANYRKVEIIIDEADFLPKAIQIYNHNGTDADPSSTVLTFDDREVNFKLSPLGPADPLGVLNWVNTEFKAPATPFGWRKEVQKFNAASGEKTPASGARNALRTLPQIPLRKK